MTEQTGAEGGQHPHSRWQQAVHEAVGEAEVAAWQTVDELKDTVQDAVHGVSEAVHEAEEHLRHRKD